MQAILITAYKEFDLLGELVSYLTPNFDIYIHIDRKSNISGDQLRKIQNLKPKIYSKFNINWGGINHLKAYLLLAHEAFKNPNNTYFHLISGQDFPIKTSEHFYKHFKEDHSCYGFLENFKLPFEGWLNGGMERLEYYNMYDLYDAKKSIRTIKRIIDLQKTFGFKRAKLKDFKDIYGGSTYWSLNRKVLEYVINFTRDNPKILGRFNYTFCAEELYFQTIIMNSEYRKFIVNDNLRYIDWKSGRGGFPAILDITDFDEIKSGNKVFARKFSNQSHTLTSKIIEEIHKT